MIVFTLAVLAVGVSSTASFLAGAYVYGSYKYEKGRKAGYQEGYEKCGDDVTRLSRQRRGWQKAVSKTV